jgi:hypothetical protein
MTTVTGLTADRMLAIEAASVVDGDVDGSGNLILTKHDGSQINAGSVIGPTGPQGPVGSMLPVLGSAPILDVGVSNQIRAGRQLSPADFAAIGLNAPIGLWNLSDLSDTSGNGRNLQNKGAVPFTNGINGGANTAAQFVGSTAQCLYIPDTGAADPFRIKTCTVGAWIKVSKNNINQYVFCKVGPAANSPVWSWSLLVQTSNSGAMNINNGAQTQVSGLTNVTDDRWHFIVGTFDGLILNMYIDGVLETSISGPPGPLQQVPYPVNIGGIGGDSSTNSAYSFTGRVDEVFVTADVLSEDQVRALYCAKIPHSLATIPSRVSLNVRRRKKGAAFVPSDFPTQPLRLHNFSAGSLGDQGSQNQVLANTNGAVSVAGADGSSGNAFSFVAASNQSLASTDAGLPSALATRSYGCWFKNSGVANGMGIVTWGAQPTTGNQGIYISSTAVLARSSSGGTNDDITGPFASDGLWHFAVVVEDNGELVGVKRKFYIDGRLVGISTVMNAINLGGANRFRIGNWPDGSAIPFAGQIDGVFVCDYALSVVTIAQLYAKGAQALSPSPKNVGDHIEGMDAANLYAIFDTLDSQHQIDLAVA